MQERVASDSDTGLSSTIVSETEQGPEAMHGHNEDWMLFTMKSKAEIRRLIWQHVQRGSCENARVKNTEYQSCETKVWMVAVCMFCTKATERVHQSKLSRSNKKTLLKEATNAQEIAWRDEFVSGGDSITKLGLIALLQAVMKRGGAVVTHPPKEGEISSGATRSKPPARSHNAQNRKRNRAEEEAEQQPELPERRHKRATETIALPEQAHSVAPYQELQAQEFQQQTLTPPSFNPHASSAGTIPVVYYGGAYWQLGPKLQSGDHGMVPPCNFHPSMHHFSAGEALPGQGMVPQNWMHMQTPSLWQHPVPNMGTGLNYGSSQVHSNANFGYYTPDSAGVPTSMSQP